MSGSKGDDDDDDDGSDKGIVLGGEIQCPDKIII